MTRDVLALLVRLLTGVRVAPGVGAGARQRVYFANHSSHLDFVVIWAALPGPCRARARPVAAAEYWDCGAVRRRLARRLFRAVLIPRDAAHMRQANPLDLMEHALDEGADLIVFPEGTRSATGRIAPFKPGLFHLAARRPGLELVPVFLENLNRILPKGERVPVPLVGNVSFGPPLAPPAAGEAKAGFLARARAAILELARGSLTATAAATADE